MKETALNFLIDKLELQVMSNLVPWVDETIKIAREMERNQIAEAFDHVDFDLDNGIHYYEKTYSTEDESNA